MKKAKAKVIPIRTKDQPVCTCCKCGGIRPWGLKGVVHCECWGCEKERREADPAFIKAAKEAAGKPTDPDMPF